MKRWQVLILVLLSSVPGTFHVRAQEGDNRPPITAANAHDITQLAMLGHGFVSSLAWSPDGKTLVAGSSVGVWLYDGADLANEPRLLTDNVQMTSVAFSPDGALLAVGTRNSTIQVWDVQTGQLLRVFRLVESEFYPAEMVFSPDGTVIAAGHSDGKIRLWDVTTGTMRLTLDQTNRLIMAYSPDGAVLASTSFDDSRIWLWDTASGENLDILESDYFGVTGLAYSPDGATLAAGFRDEGAVVLWDTATRQVRRVVADNTYISRGGLQPGRVSAGFGDLRRISISMGRGNGGSVGYPGRLRRNRVPDWPIARMGKSWHPARRTVPCNSGTAQQVICCRHAQGMGNGFLMSPIVQATPTWPLDMMAVWCDYGTRRPASFWTPCKHRLARKTATSLTAQMDDCSRPIVPTKPYKYGMRPQVKSCGRWKDHRPPFPLWSSVPMVRLLAAAYDNGQVQWWDTLTWESQSVITVGDTGLRVSCSARMAGGWLPRLVMIRFVCGIL